MVVICGSLRVPGGWLEEMAGGPIDLDDLAIRGRVAARPASSKPATPSVGPSFPRLDAEALANEHQLPELAALHRLSYSMRPLRSPHQRPSQNGDALAPAGCCRIVRRRAALGVGPC